jgi:phosphoglucomutase/phosphomannomutase
MSVEQASPEQPAQTLVEVAVRDGKLTAASSQNLLRWLHEPFYAPYQPQLRELIANAKFDELNSLFWERIPFGTGGRRGPMSEFGSATINARTIAESAHGLAVYVKQFASSQTGRNIAQSELRAVIACDTRHRSTEFARLTASVLAAHGFQVFFFTEPRATPELSFAVRHLGCDTGVMISASHNPPVDNGFKAYWNTGGQVLPPHDAGIIACVDAAKQIPSVDFDAAVRDGKISLLSVTGASACVDRAYIDSVCALSLSTARDIKALYTPMHGVGESSIYTVVQQAGFDGVELFESQRTRDGSFPNVPDHLPNPERPQALRPAIEFARQQGHAIVLASDPDADRLAVAVRTPSGDYVCLTGNQLGALLADYVLSKRNVAGTLSPAHFLVETLVTTPMLEAIGTSYGVRVIRDLLVGFKHIAATIDANGSDKFVFAAEESVGYLAGEYCRDKDASVAALFSLELASELNAEGRNLLDRLDDLYARHGYYHESQFVQVCPGPSGSREIATMMQALREKPPARFGSIVFDSARDFQRHEVRSLPGNAVQSPLPQPSGDLLILDGKSGDCQVSLAGRPSGTEPKIKFYLFASCPPEVPLDQVKPLAQKCLADLETALKQWLATVS